MGRMRSNVSERAKVRAWKEKCRWGKGRDTGWPEEEGVVWVVKEAGSGGGREVGRRQKLEDVDKYSKMLRSQRWAKRSWRRWSGTVGS